jgi:hypothetical protein
LKERNHLHWPITLTQRVIAGISIFTVLAIVDLRRNGRAATRWREYGVLLAAVLVAMAYGVINDQITCTISPEYFLYGKEIDKIIGDAWPPDMAALRWEAAKVGLKATWSAGLVFGVVLLLANNPFRGWPRLRNRELVRLLPLVVGCAAGLGFIGGVLGYYGFLLHASTDFEMMMRADIFRPRRFMCTWGVHLGGYLGGLMGTVVAVGIMIRRRMVPTR